MIQEKIYKYLGVNGVLETPIYLPNVYSIPSVNLYASSGKKLTNGKISLYFINVPEDEAQDWYEIDDDGQI